jgi:hypothetical protein
LNETRERYAKHNEAVRSGGAPAPGPFHFNAEFRTFKPVQTPIEHLRDILFNKITSDNVMLGLYQLLALAINDSCDMLNERNAVLEEFRKSPPDVTLVCFLGLPRRDGPVDERYPSLINGLRVRCDDAIIFGKELADHLQKHAKAISKEYGRGAPKVAVTDFKRPETLGLLPDAKEYADLLAALRGETPGNAGEAAVRVT